MMEGDLNNDDVREFVCVGTGILGLDGTVHWGGDLVLGNEVTVGKFDPARYPSLDGLPTPPSGINA